MKSIKILRVLITIFLVICISSSAMSNILVKEENEDIENFKDRLLDLPNFLNDDSLKINYPRCSCPEIIKKGDNFTIISQSQQAEDIYLYISTAYEQIVDEFWLEIIEKKYSEGKYFIKTQIPSSAPEELYNLSVILVKDNEIYKTTEPRSVSIIEAFSDSFDFIHITDFHVGDPRGFLESIKETIGYKSIKKCIKEINLLHPDFVLISGDLVFGQLYFKEYSREYKICYDMIQMFDVPTYLVPGNHDGYRRLREDGLEIWEEYFGKHYYSFNYGNYHFLGANSYDWPEIFRWSIGPLALTWGGYIQDSQLEWIENDLKNNTDANLSFMLLHHNPIWDTKRDTLINKGYENREELLGLINKFNIDMVLAGHVHFDNVKIQNDTIFITTTTPESKIEFEDGYWGYRLIEIENGEIISYNYKEPKYSIPSYNIDVEYENQFSVKVKNKLEKNISVLLKFTVPKGAYTAINGTIIKTREDHIFRTYYIRSEIDKESEKEIKISFSS